MTLSMSGLSQIWAAVFRIVLADQIVAMAGVIAKVMLFSPPLVSPRPAAWRRRLHDSY